VDGVVRNRSDTSIDDVADHRDIRHEKEQDEQKPTAMVPLIGDEAGNENGGPFEVEKLFRKHLFSIVVVSFQRIGVGVTKSKPFRRDHRKTAKKPTIERIKPNIKPSIKTAKFAPALPSNSCLPYRAKLMRTVIRRPKMKHTTAPKRNLPAVRIRALRGFA
jgi:hypothetical protein